MLLQGFTVLHCSIFLLFLGFHFIPSKCKWDSPQAWCKRVEIVSQSVSRASSCALAHLECPFWCLVWRHWSSNLSWFLDMHLVATVVSLLQFFAWWLDCQGVQCLGPTGIDWQKMCPVGNSLPLHVNDVDFLFIILISFLAVQASKLHWSKEVSMISRWQFAVSAHTTNSYMKKARTILHKTSMQSCCIQHHINKICTKGQDHLLHHVSMQSFCTQHSIG